MQLPRSITGIAQAHGFNREDDCYHAYSPAGTNLYIVDFGAWHFDSKFERPTGLMQPIAVIETDQSDNRVIGYGTYFNGISAAIDDLFSFFYSYNSH